VVTIKKTACSFVLVKTKKVGECNQEEQKSSNAAKKKVRISK